jgi:hypothetical protein
MPSVAGSSRTVALGRRSTGSRSGLVVLAVAGREFGLGTGLTPQVAAVVGRSFSGPATW